MLEEPVRRLLPPGGKDDLEAAARRASERDSFIVPLAPGARFVVGTAVLNALSQHFAAAALKRDVLGPAGPAAVICAQYAFCLTAEPVGVARASKVRALLMRRDALLALATTPPQTADIELEAPFYRQRFELMRELARRWSVDAHLSSVEEAALPESVREARNALARTRASTRDGATFDHLGMRHPNNPFAKPRLARSASSQGQRRSCAPPRGGADRSWPTEPPGARTR